MVEQYNLPVILVRQPWNKGKLTGAKPPLGQSMSGQSGQNCKLKSENVILHCSISPSTANFATAMSSVSEWKTLHHAVMQLTVQQ